MIKFGEHITIDFLGVKKDYSPSFYEKVIYKIAKSAKVQILNVDSHKFIPDVIKKKASIIFSETEFNNNSIIKVNSTKKVLKKIFNCTIVQ